MDPLKAAATLNLGAIPHLPVSTTTDVKSTRESHEMTSVLSGAIPSRRDSIQAQEQAVEELNKAIQAIQGPQRKLEFSVHKETHAVMIKVMNKDTGEIIREVPPEKILDVAAKMMEFAGLIVDKKV